MGLVQDVHAAVTRYGDSATTTALAAADIARQVEVMFEQLSTEGPLGSSQDPDLARAKGGLSRARQRLVAAAEAASASQDRVNQYADQAFPL
jgi:hypothetical protein